jgi:small-conductance mechanosensitive channel
LNEPFTIDDQIIVSGFESTVESIKTRATTIRTYDGRRVSIPNANLFTESMIVNTAFDERRSEYDVGQAAELIMRRSTTWRGSTRNRLLTYS